MGEQVTNGTSQRWKAAPGLFYNTGNFSNNFFK